jgi:hypothetical protein
VYHAYLVIHDRAEPGNRHVVRARLEVSHSPYHSRLRTLPRSAVPGAAATIGDGTIE